MSKLKTKKIYKIKGMNCASCATMIELDLEDAQVKSSCNYAKEQLKVEFNPQEVSEEKIIEIIKNLGYELVN